MRKYVYTYLLPINSIAYFRRIVKQPELKSPAPVDIHPSWAGGNRYIMMSRNNTRNIIDDGFNAEFTETAFFDGILEMPVIEAPNKIVVPNAVIPFSLRNRSKNFDEFPIFYEFDTKFSDILKDPESFVTDLRRFPGMVTLDCSVYWDSPLTAQIANVYRSRAIGCYFQKRGFYVIPNVRWGDERSYTTEVLPEKFAFLGLPKHSIVSIGTYGCCQTEEEKYHLYHGLKAMLDELAPEVVLVYGSMPEKIFGEFQTRTRFINYPDWISMKRGAKHGNQ